MKKNLIIAAIILVVCLVVTSMFGAFTGVYITPIPTQCETCEEYTFIYENIYSARVCPKCYQRATDAWDRIKNW